MRIIPLYVVSSLILLCGCHPSLTFDEPQPAGVANETAFKSMYVGRYIGGSNNDNKLTLTGNQIVEEMMIRDTFATKDADSLGYQLKGDTLFQKDSIKNPITVVVKNDSVYIAQLVTDTFFSIAGKQVLRYMNGRYFLNFQQDTSGWHVMTMKLTGRNLEFGEVSVPEDIERLKKATDVKETKNDKQETIHYSAKPTKREMKKFVRRGGFSVKETYRKLD